MRRERCRIGKRMAGAALAGLLVAAGMISVAAAGDEGGEAIRVGALTPEQILKLGPEWKTVHDAYSPAASAVAKLRQAAEAATGELRLEVVLGSWCSDSRDQVPAFIKLLEQVGPDKIPATYLGVDRAKKDPEGRSAALKIERVPTFVLFRRGAEIGRIVETPKESLEADLAALLVRPAAP